MTGDRSQRHGPGSPDGDGGPAPDIVEQTGRRFPSLNWPLNWSPRWRPPRVALILLAVGLVAGLAVGYAAGVRHAHGNASPPPPGIAFPTPPAPSLAAANPVLAQTTGTCSAQVGRELQVGVQVVNQSDQPVTLGQIHPVLPLGGLKAISGQWAPCGAIAAGQDPAVLGPGDSTWLSVTFQVLVKCPEPLPVQFVVEYNVQAQPAGTASLPGFPDLGQVPYADCQTAEG